MTALLGAIPGMSLGSWVIQVNASWCRGGQILCEFGKEE